MKSYVQHNWIRLLSVSVAAILFAVGAFPDPAVAGVAMAAPFLIGDTEPSLKDVLKALETQGTAWEAFKKSNDERIAAIKKDSVDKPLLESTVKNINDQMTVLGETIAKFQAAQARLALAGGQNGNQRVKDAKEVEHEKAFGMYLRSGKKSTLEQMQDYAIGEKAASVGSDADGGFFVTPDLSGRLVQKIFETSPLRQDAAVVTISTDALEGVLDNDDSVTSGWVGETGGRPATASPKTAKWRIPVFEQYAMPETTQALLDDAAVDVEAWLVGKAQDKMVRTENTAFFTGDGVVKPRGILTYPTAATGDGSRAWGTLEHVATGTSGGFGAVANGSDKLVDLVHKLKAGYRAGAKFYMSRAVLGEVRKLKDGNSQYLWLPAMTSLQPSQLLGYPVREMEDMPALAANSLSIAFANMALAYQIVDRQGFRLLRDPFTNKPYVRFYMTRRVGGDVLHFEALKFLKFI